VIVTKTRRLPRKGERGTTVVIVVMVTTLITAIGVFAVRNISQIDQAVGYGRASVQTMALAELGTSAAMAEIGATGTAYANEMDRRDPATNLPVFRCGANGPYMSDATASCYPLSQARIEARTTSAGGETLVEGTVAGTESGSFGPLADLTGTVSVELTEKRPTNRPIAGAKAGDSAFDVTLTTTAIVGPPGPCAVGATMAVKKVMRSHVIIPPEPGT
jgi:hypothetical protein